MMALMNSLIVPMSPVRMDISSVPYRENVYPTTKCVTISKIVPFWIESMVLPLTKHPKHVRSIECSSDPLMSPANQPISFVAKQVMFVSIELTSASRIFPFHRPKKMPVYI